MDFTALQALLQGGQAPAQAPQPGPAMHPLLAALSRSGAMHGTAQPMQQEQPQETWLQQQGGGRGLAETLLSGLADSFTAKAAILGNSPSAATDYLGGVQRRRQDRKDRDEALSLRKQEREEGLARDEYEFQRHQAALQQAVTEGRAYDDKRDDKRRQQEIDDRTADQKREDAERDAKTQEGNRLRVESFLDDMADYGVQLDQGLVDRMLAGDQTAFTEARTRRASIAAQERAKRGVSGEDKVLAREERKERNEQATLGLQVAVGFGRGVKGNPAEGVEAAPSFRERIEAGESPEAVYKSFQEELTLAGVRNKEAREEADDYFWKKVYPEVHKVKPKAKTAAPATRPSVRTRPTGKSTTTPRG
jgi:hypothetical protein